MRDGIYQELLGRIRDRSLVLGVIGLGYVGLPLAVTAASRGLRSIGFDVDAGKTDCWRRAKATSRP